MANHKQLTTTIHLYLEETESYLRYTALLVNHYQKIDQRMKWLVALASCGPLLEKYLTLSVSGISWFLLLIPLLAFGLPILKHTKTMELTCAIHSQYMQVLPKMKQLWKLLSTHENPSKEMLKQWHDCLIEIEMKLSQIHTQRAHIPEISAVKQLAFNQSPKYQLPDFVKESSEIEDPGRDKSTIHGRDIYSTIHYYSRDLEC